ncbi:MAG: GatB/YqeY domain-containing protein [Clostridia bacterium]|nr:GatB/YqeY domain-containing protein [Clostridia bacterium]
MLYDEIKKANVQAMKDKDVVARSFYSVFLNKIKVREIDKRAVGQELVDGDILNILQKTIKELEEEKVNYAKVGNMAEVEKISTQMDIASKYLPKMMSEEEIKAEILALEDKSIPNVMKHFKANFNGKCDMKKVQEVLKGM